MKLDAESAKDAAKDFEKHLPENFGQQVLDTEIVEVLTYSDDLAAVIIKSGLLPPGRQYAAQHFGRIRGQWKNLDWREGENLSTSIETAEERFMLKKEDLWQSFVKVRDDVKNGRPPIFKDVEKGKRPPRPSLSAEDKAKMERVMREFGRLSINLDVPDLEPEVVQYAFLDEDPVPALTNQIKQVQLFYRRQLNKAASETEKEQARNSQMAVSWDFGFRKISADKLYLLTNRPNSDLPFPSGKKWIVTKVAHLKGKPICWCIPIDVKTGNKIEIALNENNAFDLHSAYDKAMQGPLSAQNAKTWQVTFDLDAPSISPQAVQYAIFDADPVPALITQIKRTASYAREQLAKADSEVEREQINASQMEVAWDLGFKEVTGDKIYLIKNTSNSSMTSNGTAGKKWFVTKIVHASGKPVCWRIPVEVKTGELVEVSFNEKNMFDLRSVYDKAMKGPKDVDGTEQ